MAFRSLEIKLLSAHNIKDVYASVSVSGGAMQKQQKLRTAVSVRGGTNPKWNHSSSLKFRLDKAALIQNRLTLKIELVSYRVFFHTKIGEAVISVNELPKSRGHVTCPVSRQGTVSFAYKFGPQPQAHMGYPVGSNCGCPQPSAPHPYPYPPRPEYGIGTHCSNRVTVTQQFNRVTVSQQFNITGRHSLVTWSSDCEPSDTVFPVFIF